MQDITARARLLAVEVLLAEPELLGNDALEADLYVLRDALHGAGLSASMGSRQGLMQVAGPDGVAGVPTSGRTDSVGATVRSR